MGALAVVGGNSLLGGRLGADAPELTVDDGTSAVVVRDLGNAFLLQRHGLDTYSAAPPRGLRRQPARARRARM